MSHPLSAPIYPVGDQMLSGHDLLSKFVMPAGQAGKVSPYSDLHLKVGCPAHYRRDGDIVVLPGAAPLTPELAERLILPFLSDVQVSRLRLTPPDDVDASWYWEEQKMNFRLNVFHDQDGLAAVLRVLPVHIPDIAELGLPDELVWQEICELKQGLVLVTGPTGSGKSTTIAAMLKHLNRTRQARVITLEDPVEYIFESDRALFSQREVGSHLTSFAAGLRSALREDPDIIYVGELRDAETVALALTAAETGHLVFSTLHTRDTRSTITRIIDVMPPERTAETATQLSLSLAYVIGQKLLTRIGGGRVLAVEVMKNTFSLAHLIRKNSIPQMQSVLETGKKEGMNTFDHHLRALVQEGSITAGEAAQNSANGAAFR
ncbi:MAG: PilT/PilU family type 4a pilus ATPase [Verrucomicrobiota bacterium]